MKPRKPRPGAAARIVSPSGPIFDLNLEPTIALLSQMGFRVELAPNVRGHWHYLAGTDAERAADLQAAFDDPNVDLVFCSRGGYGCARLLPYLDLDRMAASRKLFVGFSDITVIQLALNRRGLATIYGPMSHHLQREHAEWTRESLTECLAGGSAIPDVAPIGHCEIPGVAEGVTIGGCLTLLADACGTPDQPHCSGKIVLLEDVGEQAYRVDARLTQLLNSNAIQDAAGFVVGEMTGTNEKNDEPSKARTWQEVVRERLGPLGKPMVFDFPFGHIDNSLSLPLGLRARLDAGAGRLEYLESLCD